LVDALSRSLSRREAVGAALLGAGRGNVRKARRKARACLLTLPSGWDVRRRIRCCRFVASTIGGLAVPNRSRVNPFRPAGPALVGSTVGCLGAGRQVATHRSGRPATTGRGPRIGESRCSPLEESRDRVIGRRANGLPSTLSVSHKSPRAVSRVAHADPLAGRLLRAKQLARLVGAPGRSPPFVCSLKHGAILPTASKRRWDRFFTRICR